MSPVGAALLHSMLGGRPPAREDTARMASSEPLDTHCRRRSPATMPGFHCGRPPRNKSRQVRVGALGIRRFGRMARGAASDASPQRLLSYGELRSPNKSPVRHADPRRNFVGGDLRLSFMRSHSTNASESNCAR